MRICTLLIPLLLLTRPIVAQEAKDREQEREKAPPLSLDGFLEEELPETTKKQTAMEVENGPCYVCHANYKTEGLVVAHGKAEMGCAECHGESLDHRNDENNTTPPDRMIAAGDVGAFCRTCHPKHDAPAKDVLARWKKRCPEKTNFDAVACTDCHFQHRLSPRTIRWNKKTGELVVEEQVGTDATGS
ncbi:MAG: cytochrome c3 family protein [Planctomycetota bacterium]